DSQIGFTNQNGHKKIVNTYFHQLSKASTETEEIVNYNLNTLNNDIKVKFIAIVGISLCLALLMSFAFKKIIASNLSELLIAIETNKISYFKIIPTFSKISNIAEFKIIQNKFIELATEVSIHTQDVETKNKELSNINFLLKSTVEELNLQKHELQKANTLKEIFLSIISHDVRGPLLTLQKFLDIIIEKPTTISNENKILHFKKLKDATDDQVILLQNLLNWSKTQNKEFRFTPTKINLLQMSFDVVRLISPLANQKQITIENYTENEFVKADKNMTELILRNIISNAIKFTNIGGIITIQTHIFDDDLLTIEISDNGIGIKPEVLELLNNNNFFQTTEGTLKERGSGFGLMFCRAFTEKMGGKMHIHSVFGVGTKVKVELSLVKYGLVFS
ncbi:MAG: sensor histidine kinase, partial [Cytophagales bacterium]